MHTVIFIDKKILKFNNEEWEYEGEIDKAGLSCGKGVAITLDYFDKLLRLFDNGWHFFLHLNVRLSCW